MKYLLGRILLTIPVIFGVSVITFSIIHVIPGDPIQLMFRESGVSEEHLQAMRHALGLDLPLPVQYVNYVSRAMRGDFGQSLQSQQPIMELILERIPATLELALASFILSTAIALPMGLLSALKRNTFIDYIIMTGATLGISLPTFWIGILLIMLVAVKLGWLPGFGRIDYAVHLQRPTGFLLIDSLLTWNIPALKNTLMHLALPVLTLGIGSATFTARFVRSSVLEVMGQDYVVVARAKGLHERLVIARHVLRNALMPVLTLIGLRMGGLLGGAVVTETIFAWPGMGRLVIQAIYNRDFVLVQGVVLFFALIRVTINVLTDIIYVRVDPRISHI